MNLGNKLEEAFQLIHQHLQMSYEQFQHHCDKNIGKISLEREDSLGIVTCRLEEATFLTGEVLLNFLRWLMTGS